MRPQELFLGLALVATATGALMCARELAISNSRADNWTAQIAEAGKGLVHLGHAAQ